MIAAILVASVSALAQSPVTWEHDLGSAQKRALREGKPLFVDIWAEWCPPCQHLRNNVFPSIDAQKALAGYVSVSLMTETRHRLPLPENMKVAEHFRVEGYPTLLVLDGKGQELKRHVGAFASGADLKAWLMRK